MIFMFILVCHHVENFEKLSGQKSFGSLQNTAFSRFLSEFLYTNRVEFYSVSKSSNLVLLRAVRSTIPALN